MERLQKMLAEAGVASRRKAEELIESGLVEVNGKAVTQLGYKVDPQCDIVRYRGQIVRPLGEHVYFMLNKPKGYVTTAKDQFGRRNVVELVASDKRIFPVGRLDYETEGLLLLTNDGALAYKLTHPKHNVEKKYAALLSGIPGEAALYKFRHGVDIGGFVTSPAKIEITGVQGGNARAEISIWEGKNRQIRRMCQAIGFPVVSLKRLAIGEVSLGKLKTGQYRCLTPGEVKYLRGI